MQSFKTSTRHIVIQGLLLVCLALFTLQEENLQAIMRLPVLLIVDVIVAVFFFSSFMRRITVTDNTLTVKSLWRTSSVNLNSIEYAQSLSAFARWVIILNDGKYTVIMTSLTAGFDKIAEIVKARLPESEKGKLDAITPKSVASKKRVYDSVLIMLCLIVCYGIVRNVLAG